MKKLIYLVGGLLAIIVIPMAFSTFYPGNNFPFTYVNNLNGSTGNSLLIGAVDHNGTCNDPDNGMFKGLGTFTSWLDNNGSTLFFPDTCDTNMSIIELGCVEQFKINGVQYSHFVVGAKINCDANETCKKISPSGASFCG